MKYTETEIKQDYKQYVPIENLVTSQIDRIIKYRNEGKNGNYIIAIEGLIDLLHPLASSKVINYKIEHNINYDTTNKGIIKYRELFNYIKQLLSDDNIIWKRSRGYEMGGDKNND